MSIQKTSFTLPRADIMPFSDFSALTGIALDVGEVQADDALYCLTWFPANLEEQTMLKEQLPTLGHTDALVWEDVVEENWQAKALADFPPIPIGQFVITRNDEEIEDDKIRLRIPAAMAFGSGEHATTAGCLHLYQNLSKTPQNILDMGCGSGILAIAAAKRDSVPALCIDIHEPSIDICKENAQENGVEPLITAVVGDGFKAVDVQNQKPFELIFANILAQPLVDMAADLKDCLKSDGVAILSGFLDNQETMVADAYKALGLTQIDRHTQNQGADVWVALTFKKEG
ncbi:MAG: 50S ribosomal protein L11 methyltransferase [Alphaproteobacteria bacterium]|nr:50S ribosomal protein L11 methyltransferase [Alphaproteobacteria bacterium]MDD9919287.1 50S ribosomal protein L11 methyltransferase [Alphaproteobacteria bacterium]